jgi:hypothetical protein
MVVTRGGNNHVPVIPPVVPPGLPPDGDGGDGDDGGVAPPNIVIRSHPAGLDGNAAYFTYDSAREQKYFGKATEPMETKYDGSAKGLLMFITKVEQKAELFGWAPILTIPTATMGNLSLLDHYGQITLADIKAHAITT